MHVICQLMDQAHHKMECLEKEVKVAASYKNSDPEIHQTYRQIAQQEGEHIKMLLSQAKRLADSKMRAVSSKDGFNSEAKMGMDPAAQDVKCFGEYIAHRLVDDEKKIKLLMEEL